MSATIVIGGDGRQAQQAMRGVGAAMGGFREQASILAGEIRSAMGSTRQPVKNFKLELAAVTTVATHVASAIRSIGNAVSGPLKAAAAAEDAEIAFTQFMGGATRAKDLIKEINDFSVKTPFEPAEIRDATQMLLGAGIAADDVFNIIKETAAVSKNGMQLGELGDALAKGFAKGKFQTEELNKFLERGINLMPELEKVTGKTGGALTKAIEKGLKFGDVRAAIASLSAEGGQFFGLLEKRSQSSSGLVSTLSGAWTQFKEQLATPILLNLAPMLKDGIAQLSTAIAMAPELGSQLAAGVSMAISAMSALGGLIGDVATGTGALGASLQIVVAAFLAIKVQAAASFLVVQAGLTMTKIKALGAASSLRAAGAAAAGMALSFAAVVVVMKSIQQFAERAARSIQMMANSAKAHADALQTIRNLDQEIAEIKTTDERDKKAAALKEEIDLLKRKKMALEEEQRLVNERITGHNLIDKAFSWVPGVDDPTVDIARDTELFAQVSAVNAELNKKSRVLRDINELTSVNIEVAKEKERAENLRTTTKALKEQKAAFDEMMAKAKEAAEKRIDAGVTNDRTLAMLKAEISGNEKKLQQLKEEQRIAELTAQLKRDGFTAVDAASRAREQTALEVELAAKKDGKTAGQDTGTVVASSQASVGGGRGGFATNSPLLGVNQRQLSEQQATRRAVEKIASREPTTSTVATYG